MGPSRACMVTGSSVDFIFRKEDNSHAVYSYVQSYLVMSRLERMTKARLCRNYITPLLKS